MTNEKAIERIKAFSIFLTGGNPIWDVDECREAFDIAIAAMSERNLDEWCDNCKEYDHNKHCCPRFNRVIQETVEEVKQNAEQKWIPVSEGLPEEHESIWAKAKGTDRWSESMWEKQSDEVIVTELFEDGTTRTETACTHDGEWYVKAKTVKRKIVAWMPLPMPWRGEEG